MQVEKSTDGPRVVTNGCQSEPYAINIVKVYQAISN